ncbi:MULTISPECIES: NAD(P)-binding domain-containing protein [Burkholderia]|uniref:FAD-dependent oxidoreductase n=1 Tax=Burkholderia ubonensis TaxID=101571 RepID=A0A1B4LPB5_9BURK|nr:MULTISPECIES: NAD(P)/FAD-dependent oxidoreductase [Burkholderia]AOJ79017.1 FAD-dependent oxidoreductase [Burkholderia ubonensis]AOK13476.1 FAD-dependent oxidoreductase [Burkholderia vietnamiensis]KVE00240.1 FAD-dependent oxidoreductase [Burkholderia vietnamiensis]KVF13947.1 FAD-dependent oxidoreductase [Burkholderia vietnamiensis]KVF29757.1 FAD-dependent oxidoreductase [Burkholderia vietnamiensis]
MTATPDTLAALEARVAQDLRWLDLPPPSWVPPREVDGARVLDVAIVGGGMAGLAASAELRLLGIDNQCVIDRAPAGYEGPWVTFARMETLRSPKQLAGPALGLPALTFRAWFEACHGRDAWDALYKIPRTQWMDYLRWYRRVLDLSVHNDTTLVALRPRDDGLLALDLQASGATRTVLARHVVLATGRDGLGGPYVPPVAQRVPRTRWAHSSEPIDFAALAGKRVGVVGAGASAFDNAGTALEAGAARVDLLFRRADIPRINKLTGIGSPGLVHGFAALDDATKWRFMHYALTSQTPPPRESVLRVSRHPHAYFHAASPIETLVDAHDGLQVVTPRGRYTVDFLIFATGFHSDWTTRTEFASFGPHVRRWKDRYQPPPGTWLDELAESPDLGPAFAFQERERGACPAVTRIHCFNNAASLSHGKLSGDIPAISAGAGRLARGIASRLFDDDRDRHYDALVAFANAELHGDEWRDADAWTAPSTTPVTTGTHHDD